MRGGTTGRRRRRRRCRSRPRSRRRRAARSWSASNAQASGTSTAPAPARGRRARGSACRQPVDPHAGRKRDQEERQHLDRPECRDLEGRRLEGDDRDERDRDDRDLRAELRDRLRPQSRRKSGCRHRPPVGRARIYGSSGSGGPGKSAQSRTRRAAFCSISGPRGERRTGPITSGSHEKGWIAPTQIMVRRSNDRRARRRQAGPAA